MSEIQPPQIIQQKPHKPIYEIMPDGAVRIIYSPPTRANPTPPVERAKTETN